MPSLSQRPVLYQTEQVEQAIEAGVRDVMQAVQSAQFRLDAARGPRIRRRTIPQRAAPVPRRNLNAILAQQRQTTMITARSQERRTEADLGEAIASFELAIASNLRERNITLK